VMSIPELIRLFPLAKKRGEELIGLVRRATRRTKRSESS
jgi:hypothetical protein